MFCYSLSATEESTAIFFPSSSEWYVHVFAMFKLFDLLIYVALG